MKEFSSCKMAINSCISEKYFAIAHLYNDEKPMDMHIHDSYEIYFSISGGKQFLIDSHFYNILPGDIFFINQYESHYLTQIDKEVHERIVLSIYPEYLHRVSSECTDLTQCFKFRESAEPHKLHLEAEYQKRFMYLLHKILDADGFGSDLTEQSVFIELMVFLNRIFNSNIYNTKKTEASTNHTKVDDILTYINQNIQCDLTIEILSTYFYLSSSYLCRIFKAATGTTINKYITARRITIAKSMLNEGFTVTEACEKCGFNDYSNFLKAFIKAVGVSPKKYAQFSSLAL